MATVLDINVDVPQDVIRDFLRACDGYRDKLGNSQAVALRRGTIAFIKSIRSRTPKSKKQAPLRDVTVYDGPGPHYITPKSGKFKGKSLHRFSIKRKGGADARTYVHPAESRADARARTLAARRRDRERRHVRPRQGAKPGPTAARYCQTDTATPTGRGCACLLPNGKRHNRQW